MHRSRALVLCMLMVEVSVIAATDVSGVYSASGMTVRAAEGMPSAYVSLCGLLSRDFDPANHEKSAKQAQDQNARVTLQDDLALSVVIAGGRWGSCLGTWTKADGL